MGEFTVYDDQWVDEQIQAQLDVIVQNITAAVRDREISIVLSGGFGRGEGSVIISENQVTPLKDYDIWVLSDKKIDQATCDLIRDKVYDELGFSNARQEDFQCHISWST
jgi:UTP:GlnB (protein PII) uridylyltransferase